MDNPWQRDKELNAIHRRLMAAHPFKADRTPDEETQWDENIDLYETALGKKLVRGYDNEVIFPFQTL